MIDTLKPMMEGVFDPGPPPKLLGGNCPECRRKYFPRPLVCPRCLEPVSNAELSSIGVLYSYTVVRVKPPFGLPQPYAVGYVDLEGDGLRVFGLLDPYKIDLLALGQSLALKVAPIGVDASGETCLRYYFTPHDGRQP